MKDTMIKNFKYHNKTFNKTIKEINNLKPSKKKISLILECLSELPSGDYCFSMVNRNTSGNIIWYQNESLKRIPPIISDELYKSFKKYNKIPKNFKTLCGRILIKNANSKNRSTKLHLDKDNDHDYNNTLFGWTSEAKEKCLIAIETKKNGKDVYMEKTTHDIDYRGCKSCQERRETIKRNTPIRLKNHNFKNKFISFKASKLIHKGINPHKGKRAIVSIYSCVNDKNGVYKMSKAAIMEKKRLKRLKIS